MTPLTARFLRSAILLAFAIGVSAWAALDAQETPPAGQAQPAPAGNSGGTTAGSPPAVPAKGGATSSDANASSTFKPSQEISPDQEIDFPADL